MSGTAVQAAIKRATIQAHREMDKLDVEILKELRRIYLDAAANLRMRIAAAGDAGGNIVLAQLQDLLAQVTERLRILAMIRDGLLESGLQTAVRFGTAPLTSAGAGIQSGAMLESSAAMRIADESIRFVRTFIAEDGLQLSDRIWRLDRHARDVVTNAIEMAVVQGHGATQAARELLARGQPVTAELASKVNAANSASIGKTVVDVLTGSGSPMDNAMRLMRTEINRAHGEAYISGALTHPDAAGVRFLLSPAHPEPDICDLHATANLYGLGPGVYPSREKCPWPAHPNTLSYVEVVFKDEITEADRAGKETVNEALARLTPEQRKGVLGVNKAKVFEAGKLKQGMVKSSWRSVQKRVGQGSNRGARLKPSMVSAYEIAKAGGKHSGWYRRQRELSEEQLSKGIRSFENQIARHEKWITDPTSKIVDYHSYDPRRREALIKGWKQDIERHRDSIEILRGILKERENG